MKNWIAIATIAAHSSDQPEVRGDERPDHVLARAQRGGHEDHARAQDLAQRRRLRQVLDGTGVRISLGMSGENAPVGGSSTAPPSAGTSSSRRGAYPEAGGVTPSSALSSDRATPTAWAGGGCRRARARAACAPPGRRPRAPRRGRGRRVWRAARASRPSSSVGGGLAAGRAARDRARGGSAPRPAGGPPSYRPPTPWVTPAPTRTPDRISTMTARA